MEFSGLSLAFSDIYRSIQSSHSWLSCFALFALLLVHLFVVLCTCFSLFVFLLYSIGLALLVLFIFCFKHSEIRSHQQDGFDVHKYSEIDLLS